MSAREALPTAPSGARRNTPQQDRRDRGAACTTPASRDGSARTTPRRVGKACRGACTARRRGSNALRPARAASGCRAQAH